MSQHQISPPEGRGSSFSIPGTLQGGLVQTGIEMADLTDTAGMENWGINTAQETGQILPWRPVIG